jgi:CrcB protein
LAGLLFAAWYRAERQMGFAGFMAVGVGAAVGAWLRWWLGVALNMLNPNLPYGTLAANLIGGYLVGVAVEYFSQQAALPIEVRLLVITGFLGGLTTFSSFSAEAVGLLMQSRYGWMLLLVTSHLLGSILMTLLGIFTVRAVTA